MNRQDSLFDLVSSIPLASECAVVDMDEDDLLKIFEVTDEEIDAIIKAEMQKDNTLQQQTNAMQFNHSSGLVGGHVSQHVAQNHNSQAPFTNVFDYTQQVALPPVQQVPMPQPVILPSTAQQMVYDPTQQVPMPQHVILPSTAQQVVYAPIQQMPMPQHVILPATAQQVVPHPEQQLPMPQHVILPATTQQLVSPPLQQVVSPPLQQVVSPPLQQLVSPPIEQVASPPLQQVVSPPIEQVVSPPVVSPPAQQEASTVDTKEVKRIKFLLSALSSDDAYLENADLMILNKNISAFSDEDIWKIPNVYLRGTGSLAIKHACEIMLCIKMICIDQDIDLRRVLHARFSNASWVDCPCVNATGKNKGDVCERERRYGLLACSRHSLSVTRENIIEYCAER